MAQNKLSGEQKKIIQKSCIEPFAPTLSPLIKESLEEVGKESYREGTLLIPMLVVWLVLAMTMRRDLNYYQVLEWMISSYRWLTMVLPASLLCDGAITRARIRVGKEVFRILFYKLTNKFHNLAPDFHGRITLIFDGVILRMPDTKENEEKFGKHKTNKGSSGFPMMRVVTMMAASTRMHLDLAFASYVGKGTGERSLTENILKRCTLKNIVFLFDAGFYSQKFLAMLKKYDYIMKISSTLKLKPTSVLSDGSYLVTIKGITVRVIYVHIKGFRPFRLITSLLDIEIGAMEIVTHYHERWGVEISYDEIKTHQCATLTGQAPTVLRSKKSDLVEQELYALLISYNMTRWLMFQAANEHNGNPLDISFLNSLQWIIDAADKSQGYAYLIRLIAEEMIDRPRRNRSNPRVIKLKMSKFKRKRKGDKGSKVNYGELTQILSDEEFKKAA